MPPPHPWDPEREVTTAEATALVASQFPALAFARVEPLAAGWDNTVYLVDGSVVFRFPRRSIAVPLMRREIAVLPYIAPRLPIPVPVPSWIGMPSDAYPWPFAGYPMLPGRSALYARLDAAIRARMATPLAAFLTALHALPTSDAAAWGAEPDDLGRLDMDRRCARARLALDEMVGEGLLESRRPWDPVVDAASGNTGGRHALVHGDLHSDQILVDDSGTVTAIIDWGDVHLGHPALDLSIAWTLLPPAAREQFFAVYGSVDDATRSLARFRALQFALDGGAYARARGDDILDEETPRMLFDLLVG